MQNQWFQAQLLHLYSDLCLYLGEVQLHTPPKNRNAQMYLCNQQLLIVFFWPKWVKWAKRDADWVKIGLVESLSMLN